MPLSIKNPEVDRLARELAEVTGESMTDAICKALKLRLEKETGRNRSKSILNDIQRMQSRVARLRPKDQRNDEDVIGYDKHGIPE